MVSPTLRQRIDVTPTREAAHELFKRGDLVPVYRTLLADLETPVSVFMKLTQSNNVYFMLESVEGGEQVGRYSFIGVDPRGIITFKDNVVSNTVDGKTTTTTLAQGTDPLHFIKQEFDRFTPVHLQGLPRLIGGAVGFIGYDIVRYFETLPDTADRQLDLPDAAFMIPDTLVIFDHAKHQLIVMANAYNNADNPDGAYNDAVRRIDQIVVALGSQLPPIDIASEPLEEPLVSNVPREKFEANVRAAKEYIAAGDAFQIVISQRFSRRTTATPLAIYRAVRALNPSPYMFYLNFGQDFILMGASPEMMVRMEDGIATNRPLAGTRKRGATDEEDKQLEKDLLADPKERAEHVMLVDLGRNDLGRVSEYGSVKVTDMMTVERYSHVMHIVSQVQGKVRDNMDAFDLFRATFPAGTLSGAPKVRAMEIIEELEGTRRGPYGGAVGYFSLDGSMDTCITIRALVMRGDRVYIQAGAGIVADSDPATEYEETINKAKGMAVAIDFAERGLM
ncbi:MAG: anthranilate synthase component I [Aggregatilineales bacterium]